MTLSLKKNHYTHTTLNKIIKIQIIFKIENRNKNKVKQNKELKFNKLKNIFQENRFATIDSKALGK